MGTTTRLANRASEGLTQTRRSMMDNLRALARRESAPRTSALQISKATLAAIGAWYAAGPLFGSTTAWLAPMTAVLMVHSTVYRSIADGIKRVVAVGLGVGLAAAAGNLIGLNALGLLVLVPLSLLGARVPWIRAQGEYIAVTGVILLTFGVATQEGFLISYLRDTALGTIAGALVNLLLFPSAYQGSATTAISDLATDTANVLRAVAEGARSTWGPDETDDWRHDAERLEHRAQAAQSAIEWSRQGERMNPWRKMEGAVSPQRYQRALDTLWHSAIEVRGLTRSLDEAASLDESPPPLHDDLAPLLESVAEVVETYGDNPAPGDGGLSEPVAASLDRADELFRDMADKLPSEVNQSVAFEASGSLLQDLRRILDYLHEAGRRQDK